MAGLLAPPPFVLTRHREDLQKHLQDYKEGQLAIFVFRDCILIIRKGKYSPATTPAATVYTFVTLLLKIGLRFALGPSEMVFSRIFSF